jgi:hypothetical protein
VLHSIRDLYTSPHYLYPCIISLLDSSARPVETYFLSRGLFLFLLTYSTDVSTVELHIQRSTRQVVRIAIIVIVHLFYGRLFLRTYDCSRSSPLMNLLMGQLLLAVERKGSVMQLPQVPANLSQDQLVFFDAWLYLVHHALLFPVVYNLTKT